MFSHREIYLQRRNFFSCASAKAERSLSSLSCVYVCICRPNKGTPPAGNGFSTGNSLISSLDLDSPQKFNLEWYLFLNGSLQITLLQIYFWYYKIIWDHFKRGGILLLQTTANQSANQNAGTTKNPTTYWTKRALIQWECMTIIPHATEAIRMQAFQTHIATQPISIQLLQTQQKPCYRSAAQCWKAFLVEVQN